MLDCLMAQLRVFDEDQVHRLLDYEMLIQRLREGFREPITVPLRHHHHLPHSENRSSLILMPCWDSEGFGVKLISLMPDNAAKGLPSIQGTYLLFDGETGTPDAAADAAALTQRRTAAASALASSYLARQYSESLLMVGAGALAPHLIRAHSAVRPIQKVFLFNRTQQRALALANQLSEQGFDVEVIDDLKSGVAGADIVSCATASEQPLVKGRWVQPGTHLDLVGGFTRDMREVDDEAVAVSRIFVDTREGALSEAGDLIQALESGVILEDQIEGELSDLVRMSGQVRQNPREITLFKSVGTALEDLVAARLLVELDGC